MAQNVSEIASLVKIAGDKNLYLLNNNFLPTATWFLTQMKFNFNPTTTGSTPFCL